MLLSNTGYVLRDYLVRGTRQNFMALDMIGLLLGIGINWLLIFL